MAQPATPRTALGLMRGQFWDENPIFRQVLGICSALAVTNLMVNTALMCLGLVWATAMSSLTISLLRAWVPERVRLMASVLVISVYVIMVDIAMRVWAPDVHRQIAAYVGLIITNCIILGRMEAFAIRNRPVAAFWDGLGAGLGYSAILLAVATVREVLGFGSLFGWPLPLREHWWHRWVIAVTPPGGFFVLAVMVWIARSLGGRPQAGPTPPAAPAASPPPAPKEGRP